ncbi:uncharacterized protein SPPG_01431 [Spizellomyces punctatus DAOM BR117]|uniref:Uncharacterized protein n=1 Tax=Spizellomyces punctatus (strain DAOM BR117) TaxID=645134 RepID=A0A0L0HS82_SPIPD|nr:uncharacterized protein SPPG_01431 [Spizellomyces punctatus DAOM BR117]KND03983.1 hypothetical protein SPPG_01431 [Spizellomyces punctatus DAOM BR117]|eukprot:XP_016612022.1 hypothetical protein SPPG_01431 [Spizellomyces punctatus DAOM BR117]
MSSGAVLPIDESPNDEQVHRLEELQQIRTETHRLNRNKTQILAATQRVEKHDALMTELNSEQRKLLAEKLALVDKLKTVQKDMDEIRIAQRRLREMNAHQQAELRKLREDYQPLKDRVDALRQKHGLAKLPNVQDEIENETARYLQERRERWRDSGLIDTTNESTTATRPSISPSISAQSSAATTPLQSPRLKNSDLVTSAAGDKSIRKKKKK